MVELTGMVDNDEAAATSSTAVLTEEGWQVTDYEEPGQDWRLLGDGSWESPDGRTRSFVVDAPNGE
jgi:hypothetical protein